MYRPWTELSSIISQSTSDAEPNKTKAINIGPIAVPNELTPPAKLSLFEPVDWSPRDTAKGFAAVCWSENPNPIINNAIKT